MLRAMFGSVAAAVFVLGLAAAPETAVKDKQAKQMLLGKHPLTLQWVTFGNVGPGEVTVTEADGLLSIRGEQRDPKNGNYVTIEGVISSVEAKSFSFEGSIVIRLVEENNGEPCTRSGKMTFRITGKRKYWRLKENRSPCTVLTDYVDIHFSSEVASRSPSSRIEG